MKTYLDNFDKLMQYSMSFFVAVFLTFVVIIVALAIFAPWVLIIAAVTFVIGRIVFGILTGV